MSTLIFDRTQADTDRAAYLIGKIQRGEMLTEAEQAEYNAGLRGCYNITDLNRVEAKVRELAETLRSYGYSVGYTVPLKGEKGLILELASKDFQQAPYLYATGLHDETYSDGYISTINDYSVYNEAIIVSANINLGPDSGFLWYDENGSFISGAVAANINGSTMSAMPPDGADYCKFNINATGITPSSISTAVLTLRSPEEYTDREWQYTDTMLEPDVLLYLENIAALRDVIQLPPDVPPIPTIDRWIDWMAANDIERIVYELDRMIYGIVPLFRRCGTFRAGKNAQHLLLAKGVN